MAKILKDSIKPKIRAKKEENYKEELYSSPYSREKVWYKEGAVRQIGEEAIAYFKANPKAIKIAQFLVEKGIYRGTWGRWLEKYEFLREMQDYCFDIIGNRREVGMVFLDEGQRDSVSSKVMWIYDKDWARADERLADIKATAAQKALHEVGVGNGETKFVVVEIDKVKIEENTLRLKTEVK